MLGTVNCQLPCDVVCAAFGSQRSRELVACGGQDTMVHVLPFGDGTRVAKLEGHTSRVTAVAFDPDQRRVLAGSDGGSIRLWDLDTEQGIRTFGTGHRTTVSAVHYHSLAEFIATASEDTHLRIWDVRKKSCLQSYKGVPCGLRAVQFNPNGKWVASGCAQGVVRLYDLTNGRLITELTTHNGPITSLKFHPEHLFLAAGSADGTMSLWELDTFQLSFRSEVVPAKPVHQVHFTTEADTELLVASDHLLRVYPFSRMSDRSAAHLETSWSTCSDIVYSSNSGEALTVECNRSSVNFSRIAITKKSVPIQRVPSRHQVSGPTNKAAAAPAAAAPAAPRPAVADSKPAPSFAPPPAQHGGEQRQQQQQPMVFQMNERQTQQLLHAAKQDTKPSAGHGTNAPSGSAPGDDAATDVEQLIAASPSMVSILQRRLTHLRVVRSTWPTDPRSALRHLLSIAKAETDCGVVTDFLNAMQHQRMKERVTFDLLPEFLALISGALLHKQDPIVLAALRVSRSMNTKFRMKIDETLRGAQFIGNGVDLAMEARIEKCRELQSHFEDILGVASGYSLRKDAVGDESRLVVSEIPSLRRR